MRYLACLNVVLSCMQTWSDKQYVFSAVTAGIRYNWLQALRNAANFSTSDTLADNNKRCGARVLGLVCYMHHTLAFWRTSYDLSCS